MSNFKQNNQNNLKALLAMASKELGTTPDVLQKQLSDGTFEKALKTMPGNEAAALRQALSNPKTAQKILSTPQAKAIYSKLNGGK